MTLFLVIEISRHVLNHIIQSVMSYIGGINLEGILWICTSQVVDITLKRCGLMVNEV